MGSLGRVHSTQPANGHRLRIPGSSRWSRTHEPALDIPYSHHERRDGSGYPEGLSGEGIPLAARVFAVVEDYDALTSNRPYRRAWEHDDATAYVSERSGRHFDPAAVAQFLVMTEEPLSSEAE